MFALGALATLTLIGAALYGVLERELTRHQYDELNTNLQNMRYSIERFGDLEHWARLQVKMDTLTPADGSVRFWVLSDDPRFLYGKGLDEMERVNQGEAGRGMLTLPSSGRTYRTLAMRLAPGKERNSSGHWNRSDSRRAIARSNPCRSTDACRRLPASGVSSAGLITLTLPGITVTTIVPWSVCCKA